MLRLFYFAVFMNLYWEAMGESSDETLRGISNKAVKETAYHIRHAGEWIVRLGDGTEVSAERMRTAVDAVHLYTNELFELTEELKLCAGARILPDPSMLRDKWNSIVEDVFSQALLTVPEIPFPQSGQPQESAEGQHGGHHHHPTDYGNVQLKQ